MLACHGCLKHGCKLYDIRVKRLEQAFSDLTGLPVSGGLLCGICLHLLLKFQDFRECCRNSCCHILKCMMLNKDASETRDRSNITIHLSRTTICHVNCEPPRKPTKDIITIPDDTDTAGSKNNEIVFMDMEKRSEIILSDLDDDVEIKMDDLDNVETESVETDTEVADDVVKINNGGHVDNIFMKISPAESDEGCVETTIDENTVQIIDYKDKGVTVDKTNMNNVVDNSIETNIEDSADIDITHNSNVDTDTDDLNDDYVETNLKEPVKTKTREPMNKVAKAKLDEDKINLTYLFKHIRKGVDKTNDDYYQMFERLYNFSQLEEKPKHPEINFKIKNNKIIYSRKKTKGEMDYFENFLKLYEEIGNSYNFDFEIISVMEERKAMEEKRKTLTEDSDQCKMCLRTYITDSTLKRHMKLSHNEAHPFQCEVCMYTFSREAPLFMHIFRCHCTRRKCKDCDKTVSLSQADFWYEVVLHFNNHRNDLTSCHFCGRTFTYAAIAANGMNRSDERKRGLISKLAFAQKHYYAHIRVAHRAEMNAVQCLLCGDSYNGPRGLKGHVIRIHVEAVKCATCDDYFKNKEVMAAHISETGECLGVSGCPICGAIFPTKSLMKEHYDEVHAEYKCNKCNLTFIENESYRMHRFKICAKDEGLPVWRQKYERNITTRPPKKRGLRKPGGVDKKFICDVCGSGFNIFAKLGYHMRVHTGEKPFKCDYCDKSFRLKGALGQHIWTHTGQRPYKCELCSKTFRQYSHVRNHILSHTNEKKYACNVCEKRYTSNTSLRDHIQSVHMGVPVPPRQRKRMAKNNDS